MYSAIWASFLLRLDGFKSKVTIEGESDETPEESLPN